MKLLEIRSLDSLTIGQRRLLDELLACHPAKRRGDLVAYVIEGVPGTRLLQRLLVAPSRDDVRPGDDVVANGSLWAGAGTFVLGSEDASEERIELAGMITPAVPQ
jgi:hypothetical protein